MWRRKAVSGGWELRFVTSEVSKGVGRSCINGYRDTRVHRGMNYVRAGTNLRPVRVITS